MQPTDRSGRADQRTEREMHQPRGTTRTFDSGFRLFIIVARTSLHSEDERQGTRLHSSYERGICFCTIGHRHVGGRTSLTPCACPFQSHSSGQHTRRRQIHFAAHPIGNCQRAVGPVRRIQGRRRRGANPFVRSAVPAGSALPLYGSGFPDLQQSNRRWLTTTRRPFEAPVVECAVPLPTTHWRWWRGSAHESRDRAEQLGNMRGLYICATHGLSEVWPGEG